MSEPIKVPPIVHPTLCYKTPPLDARDPNTMWHCDKPKGHAQAGDAKHSWERD